MGNCAIRTALSTTIGDLQHPDHDRQHQALQRTCELFYREHANSRAQFQERQNMAADMGIVDVLVRMLGEGDRGVWEEDLVFHCLKWTCLNNKNVCVCVYTQPGLFDHLANVVRSAAMDDFFIEEEHRRTESALRLVNTVARSVWGTHELIAPGFVPAVVRLLEREDMPEYVHTQCLTLLGILACNPAMHQHLKANQAVLSRLVAQLGGGAEGTAAAVAAAVAMAQLYDEHDHSRLLNPQVMTSVITGLLGALSRTVMGYDYPPGSNRYHRDWTLVLSLANFARTDHNKKLLVDCGVLSVLDLALQNPDAHPRLQQCSLTMIQDLCQYIQASAVPAVAPASWNTSELFGRVLAKIVARNDEFYDARAMPFQEGTVFETPLRACITIEQYLQRIDEYASCSSECFLIAPALIGKLEQAYGKALIRTKTVHRLVLTAVMLAAKTHDDEYLNNRCYAQIGGITLEDMNALEMAFVTKLDHNLVVPIDDYDMCRKGLELLALGGQLLTPRTTHLTMLDPREGAGAVVPWPGVIHRNLPGNTPRLGDTHPKIAPASFMLCLTK